MIPPITASIAIGEGVGIASSSSAFISKGRIDVVGNEVVEEDKKVDVYLQPDEVSLAIGKGGYNIKLASMLTGYQIDVYREMDDADTEDIYLDEFNDEIDQWVLDAFKAIGLDTAKAVLGVGKEDLMKRVDLEEETIDEVLSILASEFEE